ncbi:hypothetical protein KIM322_14560 [Lactobacillus xylocopicola]|uniref:Transposase n=1 Tax=Lactobacillus xylocopicola TaxID=2976676 RepID=A0ABM8BIQ5_9LACO|nr:hypothetical protein KIM322_14560 [Lactobacillus xylocopicola]
MAARPKPNGYASINADWSTVFSERAAAINQRREFGHWECDLVLGHKTTDDHVLLPLYERMTRKFMIIPIKDKTATSVMTAFKNLRSQYQEQWDEVFKTITTDNGSEFADLAQLEGISQMLVYYAPLTLRVRRAGWSGTPDELYERRLDCIYQGK